MIRINPDPHTDGYTYVPQRAVTACFLPGEDMESVLNDLAATGLANERVDVFMGPEGARQMDLKGKLHSNWVQFIRYLERVFGEDYSAFQKAENILHEGGSQVTIYVEKDEDKKQVAGKILKDHHGTEVMYWGPWNREYL